MALTGWIRLAIDEPRWKRAMEAISDAIRVESSKSYVRFYQRPSPDKPFVQLSLDIAKL